MVKGKVSMRKYEVSISLQTKKMWSIPNSTNAINPIIHSARHRTQQRERDPVPFLLHLADDLTSATQALHHLLALLSSADRVITLLKQVIQLVVAVHVLQQLALHLVLGEPGWWLKWTKVRYQETNTYCTSVYITALGTMSIIVRFTMLK